MAAVAALAVLCTACSVTRRLNDGQYLLQKVTIDTDGQTPKEERITAPTLEQYVRQTPNKRFSAQKLLRLGIQSGPTPTRNNWWNNFKRKVGRGARAARQSLTEKSVRTSRHT